MVQKISSVCAVLLCRLLGFIPLTIRRKLGSKLGVIASILFLSREKQIIKYQLLKYTPKLYSTDFYSRIFSHFGRVIFENLNTAPIIKQSKFTIVSNSNVTLDEVKNLKNGALALTGHFGNWDVLGGFFASIGVPLYTIGRRARSQIGQSILEKIRSDNGVTTLWRDDEHSAKEIVSLFKSGKLVAALIDQDTPVRSIFVNFFGAPVKTPSGIVTLANRFNRPIYISFIAQEQDLSYTIYVERVDPNLSEVEVLELYHKQLEAIIHKYPHQWVWFHKRWRTSNSEQKTLGTSEYINWLKSGLPSLLSSLILTLLICLISGCGLFTPPLSLAKQAQLKAQEGNIDEAIELYQKHFRERLDNASREEWENPYFYQMIIGDLLLEQGKFDQALESYLEGFKNGVDLPLFLDRIRSLALKLEESGELEKALKLLSEYVNQDPTLINEALDRISKKLLKK
jgi:KDO2-lipid IV(A) lauroyltransferase